MRLCHIALMYKSNSSEKEITKFTFCFHVSAVFAARIHYYVHQSEGLPCGDIRMSVGVFASDRRDIIAAKLCLKNPGPFICPQKCLLIGGHQHDRHFCSNHEYDRLFSSTHFLSSVGLIIAITIECCTERKLAPWSEYANRRNLEPAPSALPFIKSSKTKVCVPCLCQC